jgi:hypothetical protein
LFQLVEAPFHDVPAAVADLLIVAEVDRPPRLLAAVGDLVVAFGDRGGDPVFAQPCSVRS